MRALLIQKSLHLIRRNISFCLEIIVKNFGAAVYKAFRLREQWMRHSIGNWFTRTKLSKLVIIFGNNWWRRNFPYSLNSWRETELLQLRKKPGFEVLCRSCSFERVSALIVTSDSEIQLSRSSSDWINIGEISWFPCIDVNKCDLTLTELKRYFFDGLIPCWSCFLARPTKSLIEKCENRWLTCTSSFRPQETLQVLDRANRSSL